MDTLIIRGNDYSYCTNVTIFHIKESEIDVTPGYVKCPFYSYSQYNAEHNIYELKFDCKENGCLLTLNNISGIFHGRYKYKFIEDPMTGELRMQLVSDTIYLSGVAIWHYNKTREQLFDLGAKLNEVAAP